MKLMLGNSFIYIFLCILLSSCNQGAIFGPTLTPTITSTATITPTSTKTPTPTITPTPTKPSNPGYFEGVGEIVEIERHDRKWYGIDSVGRAEIVFNDTGNWVKYNRPILGADFDNYLDDVYFFSVKYNFDTEGLNLNEVPASEIKRLANADGSPVSWGFQKGSTYWSAPQGTGSDPKRPVLGYSDDIPDNAYFWFPQFAGYFIGEVTGVSTITYYSDDREENFPEEDYFVFEIPYKYSRQIILIPKPPDEIYGQYHLYFSDTYKDDSVRPYGFSERNFGIFLTSNLNDLRGQQCVISLTFSHSFSPPDLWPAMSMYKPFSLLEPVYVSSKSLLW